MYLHAIYHCTVGKMGIFRTWKYSYPHLDSNPWPGKGEVPSSNPFCKVKFLANFPYCAMLIINHSDYSVIFITNWSPLMFLTDDKFLGYSQSFTQKICVQKKLLRWDQLSSENWPFHQWTLSADNKEKVKYERGSHLEILQRSSFSLPTSSKLYKK